MFEKSYYIPLAIVGVPIPGKTNPYIITRTNSRLVSVEVSLESSKETLTTLRGTPSPDSVLVLAVKSFVDAISYRLEESFRVRITYESKLLSLPSSHLFSVISTAIIEALVEAGGYEMTGQEIVKAGGSIDRDAGTDYDYITGLRLSILELLDPVFVYRNGEEPIGLPGAGKIKVEFTGEEKIETNMYAYTEKITNLFTRLAGMNVIDTVERLRNSGTQKERMKAFEAASRIDNSLYYALYGLKPIDNCKWIPSFGAGFGLCVEKGMGEIVEVYW